MADDEGDLITDVGDPAAALLPPIDAVESALAEALRGATVAGRWDVVAQLARELEARRAARSENVVQLDAKRAKRGGL